MIAKINSINRKIESKRLAFTPYFNKKIRDIGTNDFKQILNFVNRMNQ